MSFNYSKFVAICGRLGSTFDGERSTAAELATNMLRNAGLSWSDVIVPSPDNEQPAPQPHAPRPDEAADLLRDLLGIIDTLTEKRAEFVRGCLSQKSPLTPKQIAVLRDMWQRHFAEAVRA